MSRQVLLALVAFVVVLFAAAVGGAWWYLYGPNEIASEELVPANTLVFASIPNAADIVTGYQTSQLKTLLENPNMKPLCDAAAELFGTKNIDLLHTFIPNLSGQSFFAITHFDADHPEKVGLIAAMKPKAGLGDFGSFLEKLKATYPDVIKQGKTGAGTVEGVDYEWIQGPSAPDKICVAQVRGWIVTTWGEAPLADWIQRFRKKSTTTSLAHDVDYRKSMERIGDAPMTIVYVNYHVVADILQKRLLRTEPVLGENLAQRFEELGGAALGSRFENGEIVDRYSFLIPRPDQLDLGMGANPCAFETLRFTGPDTCFYWASSVNWKQVVHDLKGQMRRPESVNPMARQFVDGLQNWVHDQGLDTENNLVEALGAEVSVQVEWPERSTYPEAGLFVKLDNPEQFKPTLAAIIGTAAKAYGKTATLNQLNRNGQDFAVLKFTPPAIFSPTITENGNYLGVFLTSGQAVRSFSRDASIALDHNDDFTRQIGDKRTGAAQILFFDSPYLLDRAYRTILPYVPFAEMFNKDVARLVSGHQLPDDLKWLEPAGTWSCVITPDTAGVQAYSASGVGNQGIFLGAATGGTLAFLQSLGYLPKFKTPLATAPPPPPDATNPASPNLKSTWITPSTAGLPFNPATAPNSSTPSTNSDATSTPTPAAPQ